MSDNRSPADGTIRDSRSGDSPDDLDKARPLLTVLNASHQRFRILKTYAEGGLGVVSSAYDVELDRIVAIKEMRRDRPADDEVQRFLLEARLTGQLDHPGIPPVYALGYFEDGRPFYAMRLVEGVTLRSAIKDFHAKYPPPDVSRQRSMQLRQLIGAIVSVCNTLRFAHSKGVLHRDIKPSNIMLGEYGETLLLDWGLAKSQKQSVPYSDLEAKAHQHRRRLEDPEDTGTGSVMGTPHYMSPEQAEGDVDSINPRSEVYSIGATLYSVLTGVPPFSGRTREEILEKVRKGDFLPPRVVDSRVPPELNAICLKAMALERGERYADPGELSSDIEHWLADDTVSCYREPRSRRWQRWIRAHQAWVAGLAALTATCFVGLVIGTYVLSIKQIEAVKALARAEQAESKSQTITDQSRDLISHSFTSIFNSLVRNLPGTERTRLAVLETFIQQFEMWAQLEPENVRNRHELGNALYERAQIYNELNQIDLALADMSHARDVFDRLTYDPDRQLLNSCLLDRMHVMSELVALSREFGGNDANAELLAHEVYYWLDRQSDQHAQTPANRYYLAEAMLQLGVIKGERGQFNEAFELLSRAQSQFHWLASSEQIDQEVLRGRERPHTKQIQCQVEMASIAWSLMDRDFARQQAIHTRKELAQMRQTGPDDFELSLLFYRNEILAARIGALGDDAACRAAVHNAIAQMDSAIQARPNHRALRTVRIGALLQIAKEEMMDGHLAGAQQSLQDALATCDWLQAHAPLSQYPNAGYQRLREEVIEDARLLGLSQVELLETKEVCTLEQW